MFDNPPQPDVARDDFLELIKVVVDITSNPACEVPGGGKPAGLDTATALLRLAQQRRAFEADWSELDSLRASVEAYRDHARKLGQHIIDAHKPGAVAVEAVAILDGYHVGARKVRGGGEGEPGESTLEAALRLLKLALARGAFRVPTKPVRLLRRTDGACFALGIAAPNPDDANDPAGLRIGFERVGDYDAVLKALPYGPRGTAPTMEGAAQALIDKLNAALVDPAAMFMAISKAAEHEAGAGDDELWAQVEMWELAAGLVAAARSAQSCAASLTLEQEAGVDLFLPHVSVQRMQVYGHWQGFYRDGVIEGLVVRADDVPAAERAVAIELARRAYPAAFPSP